MIYTIRLVTGDEIVGEADVLDLSSDELILLNPMELVSGEGGTMYLRSSLLLSDDEHLVIPTSKIVYSYGPTKALIRYYRQAVRMYDDKVKPAINNQVLKSALAIEDAYDEVDQETNAEAMELLRSLLTDKKKKDLN